MNRQQRRHMDKVARKQNTPSQTVNVSAKELLEEIKNIHQHIKKIVEFDKNMIRSMQLLRETLDRKGVVTQTDLRETEQLYKANFERRQKVIKELLASDLSDVDKIERCLSEAAQAEGKPAYEKLSLSPIKDLNISPGVVNDYLIQKGYSGDSYKSVALQLGIPEMMLLPGDMPSFTKESTKAASTGV